MSEQSRKANDGLKDWLDTAFVRSPEALAVCVEEARVEYAQLHRFAGELAQYLGAQGVGKGDVVVLFSSSSWLITLALYACSKLGTILFPLNPDMPHRERDLLSRQAGADFIVRHEGGELLFDFRLDELEIKTTGRQRLGEKKQTDIALIIATSGSSGDPKGVMLSNQALIAAALSANSRLNYGAGDCWLNCLPPYHIGGLSIVFRTTVAGASVLLHQGFDAQRVWWDLNAQPVTHISLVPAMLAGLLDASHAEPPESLRVVLVGGAALNPKLARRALDAGWPLWVTYGMSETASQLATGRLNRMEAMEETGGFAAPLLKGMQCDAVDESGRPVATVGRLRVRGKGLMSGYANPEKSVGNGLDDNGWFLTGDLGTVDENGCVQVVGRADEVIVSGGENIHPQSVERLLLECDGIDAVCVIGRDDPVWGQVLCAVYSGRMDEAQVERWCRERLAGIFRPRQFRRLLQLPRLVGGKLDRIAVKKMDFP